MFKFICLITFFVCAFAAPADDEVNAVITSYTNQNHGDGTYTYEFGTSNGINVQETGSETGAHGSYGYTSPEGEQIQLSYVADDNGFQATSNHLPVSPPIPEGIVRALEYIRTHPPKESLDQ